MTALLHYWLTGVRGGEKVLAALAGIYPEAPIFTHAYRPERMEGMFAGRDVRESFIASLPLGRVKPQAYLPLMFAAARRLPLAEFDLIVSSESGPIKGIAKRPGQRHICYCHTPMRYLWDLHDEYYRAASPAGKLAMRIFTPSLRKADLASADSVDLFVANSRFVAERIKRLYNRDAVVIHPPVDVGFFSTRVATASFRGLLRPLRGSRFALGQPDAFGAGAFSREYYLLAGQLVAYKRPEVAIEACVRMNRSIVVAGTGPCEKSLRRRFGGCENVIFAGRVGNDELRRLYAGARGLLFPGVEDFGIVPVEAQAAGTPVLAFGEGGALETVVDGETGLFFREQSAASLSGAIEEFESRTFSPERCRANAERFSEDNFAKAWNRIAS